MRKFGVVVLIALALSSCGRKARVIPASTMSDIYADMFLADQWVAQNSRSRRVADTSDFYGPIFEKYGYTVEDYDASVSHYLHKPDKYAKILKITATKLSRQEKRLQAYEDALAKAVKFSPYKPTEFRYDTLRFRDDSLGLWPNDSSFVADTVAADTVAVDSVALDSLGVAVDSLAVEADSLAAASDSLASKTDSIVVKSVNYEKYEPKRDSAALLLLHGPDDAAHRRHTRLRQDAGRQSKQAR